MAFKLGDFFDKFGEGMKAISEHYNKNKGGDNAGGDINIPKNVLDALKESRKSFDELGEQMIKLKNEIKDGNLTLAERLTKEEELNKIQEESTKLEKNLLDLDKRYNKQKEEFMKKEIVHMTKTKKGYTDLGVASEQFRKDLEDLFEQYKEGSIDAAQLEQSLKGLKLQENISQAFGFITADAGNQFKAVGAMAGNKIGGMLSKVLPPHLQVIAKLVEQLFQAAFEQINKLNKQLIDTLRKTGGVVNNTMLGFDSMGNSMKSGIGSLETQAIAANISTEQFGQSISNLFKGGFGQIAGMKTVLKDSADELANYGVEAARIGKLYGADISGSVRNLMMNFGQGMKDSTDLVKENIDYAKRAGLNVQEVVKNLEAATALAGKFYFDSTEQLSKLTFLASTLGVSVNALSDNVIKMNGVVDLFKKQQEMAALELGNVANNLSKIYALRAQGKKGEAEQLMMSSMAKDLMSKGMINKGQVTQQGIATMEAAGVGQEVIQGLSRMARQADETGISMQKMLNPEELNRAEKRKLELAEQNNRTIEEQMRMTFGGLKQSLIDPLAKRFGPIIKSILSRLEPIIGVISTNINTLIMALEPVITVITTLSDEIGGLFKDIFEPMKRMFESIQNALRPFIEVIKQIAEVVVKFLMVPLRMVGKVIGFLFDIVSKVVSKISEAFKPAIDWISSALKDVSEGLEGFLDWIDDALGVLLDGVGWLVDGVFKVLGWTIKYLIIEPFKALWTVLKSVGEFIWEGFMKQVVDGFKSIIDFLQPLWNFFKELFEPFIWLWDLISNSRWFSSSKDEEVGGTQLTPEMIEEMWGTATNKNVEVQQQNIKPSLDNFTQQYATRTSDAQAIENEKSMQQAFKLNNNIVVNTKVDPILPNPQTIKVNS